MIAYWYFVVYVSPVLLVVVCAYLAWEAFREDQRAQEEEDRRAEAGANGERDRPADESWRTDPDSWKHDS